MGHRIDMLSLLDKNFETDKSGVWVPKTGGQAFGYTDGAWVERYLERAFKQSTDISSESEELETYIKDWNTEYHLSRKRKDLLMGLSHHREAKVLEIGCGCGAITRFLGEQYDSVLAVEGSYNRARLARMRTADLTSVEVVASRYQDLGLEGTFDIVFCIGVLEYAPSYVDAANPFTHALESMRRMLKANGTLVIAIENKFGLKYFANSREDHAGTFFEGIEGYPRTYDKFETFGRKEFSELLGGYWPDRKFYYPFPDYKMPSMLLSDETLSTVDTGEMLASLHERDYAGTKPPFFDNRLAWPEVARNGLAADLANSFLVVASAGDKLAPLMEPRLGVLFNRERRVKFSTQSIIERKGEAIVVRKILPQGESAAGDKLHVLAGSTPWLNRKTVAYELFRRAHSAKLGLREQAEPVRLWWDAVLRQSSASPDGPIVGGNMIDAVWHNACPMPDGTVAFFDQELIWNEDVLAKDVFLRAAFLWAARYQKHEMPRLNAARIVTVVKILAREFGIEISGRDFDRVVRREAKIQSELGARSESDAYARIRAKLFVPYHERIVKEVEFAKLQSRRARNLIRRVIGK
jgi:2-polyprenyl-3-methyl-5-hydroxy-6-metoxy-1,4-benzoquinol methylase